MKLGWPQRQILTIRVVFRALSTGGIKNQEKDVRQGQKLKILVNSIKLPWGTTAKKNARSPNQFVLLQFYRAQCAVLTVKK